MPIEKIKAGEKAKSQILNDNFTYIAGLVANLSTKIDGSESTIDSKILTTKNKLTQEIQELETELSTSLNTVEEELTAKIDSTSTNANSKISATIKKDKNGYCKFSNGIIVQWGRIETSFSGEKTITLPTPFTSKNYSVVSGLFLKTDFTANWSTYNYSTTTFVLHNESSGAKTYTWLAVGY